MIFGRRRREQLATPWPGQGFAFRLGQVIGRVSHYMAGWSRMARASIVIVGMAVAIPLFWLGRPGLAVVVGFVALAIFWLTLPAGSSEPEPTEAEDENC